MYEFTDKIGPTEYDDFVKNHQYANLLQSSPWTKVKAEWLPLRVGVRDAAGKLIATAQILRKPLFVSFAFWYLPHGPLLDFEQEGLLEFFLQELAQYAKKSRCLLLRVHPPFIIRRGSIEKFREEQVGAEYLSEKLNERFHSCGFKHQEAGLNMADTIQPRFQAVIYKDQWVEPPKGKIRYNLKLNERYHIEVKDRHLRGLDEFSNLIELTEQRQGVALRGKEYFERLLRAYKKDAILALAEFNLGEAKANTVQKLSELKLELEKVRATSPKKARQLEEQILSQEKDLQFYEELGEQLGEQLKVNEPLHIAGMLAIRYGRAADMPYAALDESFGRIPAVWSLYYYGIRWAFDHGVERYNLGGLEGTFDDGLTTFKSHFNPVVEETAGEYDFLCRPLLGNLLQKALKKYRKRLG